MAKRSAFLSFIFVIFSFGLLLCDDQVQIVGQESRQEERTLNSWDKVAALYLPSIANKVETSQRLNFVSANNLQDNKDKKFVIPKESDKLVQALNLELKDSLKQVITYFANQTNVNTNLHDEKLAIFDDTTYRDLNIFSGSDVDLAASFFNIIDKTKTVAGKASLLDFLYNPTSDINILLDRQNAIKKLVQDEDLYNIIEEKFNTIKEAEKTLFLILSEIHFKLIKTITDEFYLKSIFELPGIGIITSLPFVNLISYIDKAEFMKKFNSIVCDRLNKKPLILDIIRLQKYFIKTIVVPAILLSPVIYFGYKANTAIKEHNYWNATKNISSIVGMGLAFGWSIKIMYQMFLDQLKTESLLHDTVGQFAKMAAALKDLQEIVNKNPELSKQITLNSILEKQKVYSEFNLFLTILENERFRKPTTWKDSKGNMMAAFKLLHTLKYDLINPYLDMGRLDVLMSVATLYKSQENNLNAKYYFANYKEQEVPHLELNNFWNPFINPDIVVTNSVELGSSKNIQYRNMLITGPNAGGKSTALKAIAYSILLAQTLTISNGELTLTPFSKVFTTLNITDKVGKESLYQADKNRVKQVTSVLAGLDADQKAVLISDEMFNSTGASYGAALFYGTLNYIDDVLKNTLFVAATHFEQLVELEADTKGSVANFRVEEAKLGTDGKLTWTYKIKQGINKQNISFELAQEDGFDPRILDAGKKLLQKNSNK